MAKHICVIGAGPSGITAAKNLLDEGLQVTVFDYGTEVGGNWVFNETVGHSSVFETTHIISSKTLSQYDDFPMPADYPDYPSHRHLAAYFQAYARQFNLYPHIQFQTLVKNCQYILPKHAAGQTARETGRWAVTIEKQGKTETHTFDALAVCNGHHWLPRMPQCDGHFDGSFIHSHAVKRFSVFAGQRVLVIGGGNSACDVAVEASRVAASVDMSWRRGYWIAPKFIAGRPVDTIGGAMSFLPNWLWSKSIEWMLRLRNGRNDQHGLPNPDSPFGSHHPTVNEDLFYTIRHGKIKPRPEIARLAGSTVHFTDGQTGEYDTIVACTGYIIAHPFFDKTFIDYSTGKVPLWLRMMHPTIDNLYFIGLFQPLGCIWPGSELQSKIMARELAGKWKRPKNIADLIEKELKNPDFDQIDTPRHTITVHYHKFRKRLLAQLA
jgi:cation diffusion facilitator CzcD-associated flavoprotein CzcO